MTPDAIKLILILGIGIPVAVIGQIIIIKKKKKKETSYNNMQEETINDTPSEASLSKEEETARNYITQYKNQYPKESVKQGLINFGISDENAEKYLDKYL